MGALHAPLPLSAAHKFLYKFIASEVGIFSYIWQSNWPECYNHGTIINTCTDAGFISGFHSGGKYKSEGGNPIFNIGESQLPGGGGVQSNPCPSEVNPGGPDLLHVYHCILKVSPIINANKYLMIFMSSYCSTLFPLMFQNQTRWPCF